MKFFSLMSVLIPVWTLDAQAIAAFGSANVGAVRGVEQHGRPVGDDRHPAGALSAMLNSPPPIIPEAPSTRLMSQVDPGVECEQVLARSP